MNDDLPKLRTHPTVLCVAFDSYVCAVAAIECLAKQLPEAAERLNAAAADFRRAQATATDLDAKFVTPALLRRQAE